MRYIITFVLSIFSFGLSHAQVIPTPTDIELQFLNTKRLAPDAFREKGGHYYTIAMQELIGNLGHLQPRRFFLQKIDKQSNAIVGEVFLAGDTTNFNYFIGDVDQRMDINDSLVTFFYLRYEMLGQTIITYPHFLQVKTDLSFVSSEVKVDSGKRILDAKTINGRPTLLLGQDLPQVPNFTRFSEYAIYNADHTLYKADTVGFNPSLHSGLVVHHAREINPLPDGRLLISGEGILTGYGSHSIDLYTADTDMNMIDTFVLHRDNGYPSDSIVEGQYVHTPNIIVLPSGNLISAGTFLSSTGAFPALAKHLKSNKFSIQRLKRLLGVDANDEQHFQVLGKRIIARNTFDNGVYFSDQTHCEYGSPNCEGSSNYIQIVSVDTNLNTRFKKYIYSGTNRCYTVNMVEACGGRSGVLIKGIYYTRPTNDDVHTFIYRIDSSGTWLNVAGDAGLQLRNRITAWPNPATATVYVDDVHNAISTVQLYNVQGQLLRQHKPAATGKVALDVSALPPGLLLLRVQTTDGEWTSLKVTKTD